VNVGSIMLRNLSPNKAETLVLADKRIRHIPVIDETGMVGMVSIGDVVRAVVSEHRQELSRLNEYIQGSY
jgi:CBS domain-containing protein